MIKFTHNSSATPTVLLTILLIFCAPQLTGSAASARFFYFNPDSAHSNLSSLKQTMDSYLSAEGLNVSFQPFTRFRDFDRQVKETHPAFLFLPEWYLKQDGNDKKFKPFMIPIHESASTYRKVLLVAAGSNLTTDKIDNTTIAMTPMGSAGMTMLEEVIFKQNGINSQTLNVITTAKDSDALFALTLGQVQAALISERNLKAIGEINPQILKTVKTIAVSQPIPLPVLCYAKEVVAAEDLDKFRKSLLEGRQNKDTAQLMEILDIDAWQTPTPQ
ncbi:MAG: PhnD/SsuA/transferrin family substrate-binding protein [Desulfobulbaceae bacterium]|nr:PhnD/SsuA/transferrin family substrate-binding protein [Desulfobulbaceae bacterium]